MRRERKGRRRLNGALITATVALLTTAWVVYTQWRSTDLNTRPYISINVMNLEEKIISSQDSKGYAGLIVLTNDGNIPATKIETRYYLTTDGSYVNAENRRYFEERFGGYPTIRYLAPKASGAERVDRAITPADKFYYFEAITSYEGLYRNRTYWIRVWKVFNILGPSQFVEIDGDAEWDRNVSFIPPDRSTQAEVKEKVGKAQENVKKQREGSEAAQIELPSGR